VILDFSARMGPLRNARAGRGVHPPAGGWRRRDHPHGAGVACRRALMVRHFPDILRFLELPTTRTSSSRRCTLHGPCLLGDAGSAVSGAAVIA
jgi:hypothetical protein